MKCVPQIIILSIFIQRFFQGPECKAEDKKLGACGCLLPKHLWKIMGVF